jgi:hypothetical protein
MLSHETGDINYYAGRRDLKILFKETNAYHTTSITNTHNWPIITWRIQAVQLDLRKNWRLSSVRTHTLQRMLTAYRNW